MELGQLRALREVGERGSIAAAATALHVTASSVSQQISALQRKAALPLTFKDGRRTVLTDAGRALAAAAVEVEVALARAGEAVAGFQENEAGTVSLAAFHSAGSAIFGRLIAAVEGPRQPTVRLSDFDVAQDQFPALAADHDLVLAQRLVGSPPWPPSVRVIPILLEPLDVAVRRSHPLAAKAAIDPADLRKADWVAVQEGFPLEHAISVIAGLGGSEARILHRINEFGVAAAVVAASSCIALMPRYTTNLQEHPDLVLRPLRHPGLIRHIDCLARPETLERASVRTVLSRLTVIASELASAAPDAGNRHAEQPH